MRLSRAIVILILVAPLALSGCIENMGDLKEALGVVEEAPIPVFAPPIAKAQANATSVLAGVPIRFLSEGSKDPQGLALSYRWDFGDERTHSGPVATHAFAKAGEYLVRLTVVNAEGLSDDDTVPVRIAAGDLAPSAAIRALDAKGMPIAGALAGEAITFDAAASDPEGFPLKFEWDFGDGATSHDARAGHAYAKPGVYDVRLRVEDAAGLAASATTRLRIGGAWTQTGAFEPTAADKATFTFPVAPGASAIEITLTFPASAGLNDLSFTVLDAAGNSVAASSGETAPATQGDATRALALDAAAIAKAAAGEWTIEVVKKRGVSVTWMLGVTEAV